MLPTNWNDGGGALPPRGGQRPSVRDITNPLTGLTIAEVKALPPDERFDGMKLILNTGRRFRFVAASVLAADGDQLLIVPTSGTGVFCAEPGQIIDMALPIAFGTADAAVLHTMPTGARLFLKDLFWEVTADWTGGSSSAIGVSSNKTAPTNWSTKGDLLGGATGDVEATLIAATGIVAGTVGADMDTIAKRRGAIWKGADTIRFDRITSAFTAGTGFVHVVGELLANPGA